MAWIKVTEQYSYRKPAFTVVYKPGVYNVTAECATLAIAANKAVRLRKTHKDEEPQEWPADKEQEASTEG